MHDIAIYSLQNVISFHFYTHLRAFFPEIWELLIKEKIKTKFNPAMWYSDWLYEINEFNKRNYEMTKQIPIGLSSDELKKEKDRVLVGKKKSK